MPQFLDHHPASGPPSQEMIDQAAAGMKGGQADPATGVKGLAWIYNDKEQWCITEAPAADAVHKYHEAMGINLAAGEVSEINFVR